MTITYKEERLSAEEYIDFLKRTDLGSQYPKERFRERIEKLGMTFADGVLQYNKIEWIGFTVQ